MSSVQKLNIAGRKLVVMELADYQRLRLIARQRTVGSTALPPLPAPNEQGLYPAHEYIRASIARDIIRQRVAAGLSQQELAKLAGIRQETLSRIENGKHAPTARILKKIDLALSRYASVSRRRSA